MKWFGSAAAVCVLLLGLGGCGALGGLMGNSEDEQKLAAPRNPPLTIPPDYNLRPPRGGGAASGRYRTQQVARQRVLGPQSTARAADGRSAGETALLRRAGLRTRPEANVRARIDSETKQTIEAERTFVDKLLKWEDKGEADAEGVKRGEEADPVGAGEKPVIKRKGGLF